MEQKPLSHKDRQDEKAEGYVPDEGKRNSCSFCCRTSKVTATVHDKCLVKMEKALNLYKIF